jgi:hypothetical protein
MGDPRRKESSKRPEPIHRNPARKPKRIIPRTLTPVVSEGLTVITCTGDRPESFNLLRRWMRNQTILPKQWIVVDDGKVPIEDKKGFEYHRREPTPQDPSHTLCLNLSLAMDKVECEKIVFMEDDDWYSPIYLEYMGNLLETTDLVGFGSLVFYYPKIRKFMKKGTLRQPALAQTAMKKKLIPIIKEICASAPTSFELCGKGLVDTFLWKHSLKVLVDERGVQTTSSIKVASGSIIPAGISVFPPIPAGLIRRAERNSGAVFFNRKVHVQATKITVMSENYLSVGMKGMNGRKGLTSHHDPENKKYQTDEDGNLLKSILKSDAQFYLELFS